MHLMFIHLQRFSTIFIHFHPFVFTLVGWLMVELLPFLSNIVEPVDEDACPEGDGESHEKQGDQVLNG